MTSLLQESPGLPGVSRADAATFILEGVRNTLRGGHTPACSQEDVIRFHSPHTLRICGACTFDGCEQVSLSLAAGQACSDSRIDTGVAFHCFPGEPLPQRPSRQQASKSFRFDGVLTDQHTAEDGSQYLHLTFNRGKQPGATIDAEFLLLTGATCSLKSLPTCL